MQEQNPLFNIYIYRDQGVGRRALKYMTKTFTNHHLISAYEVLHTDWTEKADVFVMPGGRDLPYVKKLHGPGTTIIRDYVKNGGYFLGVCAGAYFASSYVEFDKGGKLHIEGERKLQFFPGKAIGPLYPYTYHSEKGARIVPIHIADSEKKIFHVYYNGGCYFENIFPSSSYRIIATYEDGKTAIVCCNIGKGIAILSGVHFEFPLKDEQEEKNRQLLFSTIFKYYSI